MASSSSFPVIALSLTALFATKTLLSDADERSFAPITRPHCFLTVQEQVTNGSKDRGSFVALIIQLESRLFRLQGVDPMETNLLWRWHSPIIIRSITEQDLKTVLQFFVYPSE